MNNKGCSKPRFNMLISFLAMCLALICLLSLFSVQVHRRSAERLRDLCCANRGTFIKVGQHLGALDYLLPEEYTSTLKVLHSRAPQSPIEEIEQVIREDLGQEVRPRRAASARSSASRSARIEVMHMERPLGRMTTWALAISQL